MLFQLSEIALHFGINESLVVGDFRVQDDAEGVDGLLVKGVVLLFGDGSKQRNIELGIPIQHVRVPDFFDVGVDFGVKQKGLDAAIELIWNEVGGMLGEFDLLFDVA